MAAKVTQDDIVKINELYIKFKTYAEVARQTGFSPSTVKKYVQKGYIPLSKIKIITFKKEEIPNSYCENFKKEKNYGKLCVLSDLEKEEIKELWKEISI